MGLLNDDITKAVPWSAFKLHIVENIVGHYVEQEKYCDDTGIRLGKPSLYTCCNQNTHWADIFCDDADLTKYIRNVIQDLCYCPCILQKVDEDRWCAIPCSPVRRYDNEIVYSYEIMIVKKDPKDD